jgi:hypothetical protein
MKVKDLIKELSALNPELPIYTTYQLQLNEPIVQEVRKYSYTLGKDILEGYHGREYGDKHMTLLEDRAVGYLLQVREDESSYTKIV